MKYVYYIIGIMIVFSGLAIYGLFDTRIEISKPFLSINDRIISEDEFEKMSHAKTSHIMTQEQFIESIIEKHLLIQEAIKMDINKEESFRISVENFYEQSLIKILLDRKLDSLVVDVTNDEIAKYETLTQSRLFLTKMIYPSLKDAGNKIDQTNEIIEKLEIDFIDLSDDLKFIVLNLNIGETSNPVETDFEVLVYRLDDIQKKENLSKEKDFNIKRVSLFIQNKKQEQLLAQWIDNLRQEAEIWRKNE